MSKIICEVCGTAYPETADQCPICGTARPEDVQVSSAGKAGGKDGAQSSYTYVKGGRFSKANVRKRNKGNKPAEYRSQRSSSEKAGKESYRGLVIAVILLLLACLAVVCYLGFEYFWPGFGGNHSTTPPENTTAAPPVSDGSIPCTNLLLDQPTVELDTAGSSWLLGVTPEPADTTDAIIYVSSDETIATVSSEGRVTAVAPGMAVITITCGDIQKECRIICDFAEETAGSSEDPTEPEDPTNPEDPTDPVSGGEYELHIFYAKSAYYNAETHTVEAMIGVGEVFPLSLRDVTNGKYVSVTWTAGNSCVSVSGENITGVASGEVTLTATYDGITFTCRVIVK